MNSDACGVSYLWCIHMMTTFNVLLSCVERVAAKYGAVAWRGRGAAYCAGCAPVRSLGMLVLLVGLGALSGGCESASTARVSGSQETPKAITSETGATSRQASIIKLNAAAAEPTPTPADKDLEHAGMVPRVKPPRATSAVVAIVTNAVGEAKVADYKNRVVRPGSHLKILILVDTKSEVELIDERVSEEGEIFLPLLKQVPVAGKTMAEIAAQLAQLYKKYYINPEAYVEFIPQPESKDIATTPKDVDGTPITMAQVTVSGRVRNPGLFAIPSDSGLTVSQAVLKAGGLSTSAKDRSVQLTRHGPDGKVIRRTVDLRAILEEGEINLDVVVQAGDVIFVPESFW